MQPHSAGRPRDDAEARAHLRSNVQAAAGAADPGHWEQHHHMLPSGAPGDFTPFRAPDYAEQQYGPHEPFLERLAELLTFDHAAALAQRGMEAGQ